MLLKDFLINKIIKHHKIPSKDNCGKINKCEFIYFDSYSDREGGTLFDSEVRLKCLVKYFADGGKVIRSKKIEEDINYLDFIG